MKTLDLLSNAVRAKEIVTVLVRRGFGDILAEVGLPKSWLTHLVSHETLTQNIWQRLRGTLEDLGPTFVKFGQVVSSRPDLLPDAFISELKELRSQVKPVPFEDIKPILIAELGCDYNEYFSEFDTTPVACGSIGQVYKARLKEDNSWVAVKVQRPNIKKAIKADIEIISWIIKQLHEKMEELQPYDLPGVVSETGKGILQELDFTIEANNAHLFNLINPFPEEVFAPKVYTDFTTGRLTVSEWVEGYAPGDPNISNELGKRIAEAGGRSVFHQIVIAGFFHADPHSGNLLITKDNRACFIDWGLAGQLTREMRYFLADLFAAIASNDPEKVVRVAMTMAIGKKRVDETHLEKEVGFILRQYQSKFGHGDAIGKIVIDLLYLFGQNGIQLARDYSLLAKSIVSIEEVGLMLDPDFDIRPIAKPFISKLNKERWNPVNMLKAQWWDLQGHLRRLRDLPGDVQRFFRHLEDGEIKIRMEHTGLDPMGELFESSINRLVLAIITAFLLLSSSVMVATTSPDNPDLWDLYSSLPTFLGMFGFKISAVFGLWLMWDIVRHGRHKS
ncbi:ABC1 kinase family protein [Rubellicoccus peritrichatus]|uniref:AarF/UbiB family protein n=1 Tax=Rubellicoccus peritrichatus TaxID=3080537 RepID=A0AAQ3L9J0_9BACT|nr:AarF/UbiB family protein [Puniceicoccus sp. CR14]WOO40177.1 AarF/UbiB family protein [Puniceicoccus sp. CR14]